MKKGPTNIEDKIKATHAVRAQIFFAAKTHKASVRAAEARIHPNAMRRRSIKEETAWLQLSDKSPFWYRE
ncbi:hypothetical protein ACHAWC_011078 [Mediolabrus comicus]